MLKSKLLEILKTFSSEDLIRFEDFIRSPYFNKIKNVEKLFFIIKKYSPEYTDSELEKGKVWNRLFPRRDYNYGTMKNITHELQKSVENYLGYTHLRNDLDFDKHLVQELMNRNLISHSKKKLKSYEEKTNRLPSKDEHYYLNTVFIHDLKSYLEVDKSLVEDFRTQSSENSLKYFLLRYFSNTLHCYVEEQRSNAKHDFDLSDYLIEYFAKHSSALKDSPLILIYLLIIQSLRFPEEEKYYGEAKNLFEVNYKSLDHLDRMNIYNSLLTYCFEKNKAGNRSFLSETMELHKNIVIEKSNHDNMKGSINLLMYRNVVNNACNLKEYGFLKKFIQDFRDKVISDNPSGVELYSDAYLYFVEGDFDRCLESCSLTSFKDLFSSTTDCHFYKNDIKLLVIKCCYELNLTENLLSSVDSYKHYLSNTKIISQSSKERYLHFVNFLVDINSLKSKTGILTSDYLRSKLFGAENIFFKTWLLEKLDEI